MLTDECDFMEYYMDEELAAILGHDFPAGHSPPGSVDSSSTLTEPPRLEPHNNLSVILNFGNAKINSPENPDTDQALVLPEVSRNEGSKRARTTSKAGRVRPPSQTYDHIMAERKRREQLSQCFIALSAIVPGLKKMDKTSILGDTIKYLKHLQERVKTLEEQAPKLKTMETVVLVKKSLVVEDEGSSDEKSGPGSDVGQSMPEVEARVCGNSMLLKVHCEKRKGVLVKILGEVEKLSMAVVNTSVTPFGNLALDITVVAEMDKEITLLGKDIVKALRSALLQVAGN